MLVPRRSGITVCQARDVGGQVECAWQGRQGMMNNRARQIYLFMQTFPRYVTSQSTSDAEYEVAKDIRAFRWTDSTLTRIGFRSVLYSPTWRIVNAEGITSSRLHLMPLAVVLLHLPAQGSASHPVPSIL